MGDSWAPENDLTNRPHTGGDPSWTAPAAKGDIDVNREQLAALAARLETDLTALRNDITAFRAANRVSNANLGASTAAMSLRKSAEQTHVSLLEALGNLEFAYRKVIAALRGTRLNYDGVEEFTATNMTAGPLGGN